VEISISIGGYSRTASGNSISTGGFLKQPPVEIAFTLENRQCKCYFHWRFVLFSRQWKVFPPFFKFSISTEIYIYLNTQIYIYIYIYIDIDKLVVLILKATWN
jgi:hypothetical protein